MITLKIIDPMDCPWAEALQVADHQKKFVSNPAGILARALEYKPMNGICWGIYADREPVGLALVHDLTEEPACYHLCQLMIDERYQGRGYGQQALAKILNHCRREGRFSRVEVCVKKENTAAIHVYEKAGFRDLGYFDPDAPDSICMVYELYTSIHYRNIILRDLIESDIGDWIRWETVDTEWMDWDGPDLEAPPFVESEFREECEALLREPRTGFRNFFELDTCDGKHIGMVTAGLTGENYQYLTRAELEAGVKAYHTIGIVICESSQWSRGLGTQALTAFCQHFLNSGRTEIRLQTWSGNIRMVRCAEKLGFVEVNRILGNRHIRGGIYDGLTFQLDLDRFRRFLEENP